ncbi:MAG: lamin tail domain-containing protein, partial [Planctomycetes bacterium]|nr:lamin tail domain-containing protein [Planctomycetota bacterium]
GIEFNRIRLAVDPVSSATWGGIGFNGNNDNQMVCVDMEESSSAGESIRLDNSRVLIDDMTWSQTNDTILQIESSSAIVRNSVFPDNTTQQSVSGHLLLTSNPYLIFDNNIFGVHTGTKQDVLDCTVSGPTPVPQFTNNVFLGGGDDALDLDGTYAFVAGNVFMNFHRNFSATQGESYAVTSGYDGSQTSSHLIVRNLFVNCDNAALVKDQSWIDFQNNTLVNCQVGVNFREPLETTVDPGRGGYMAGNIFYNTPEPVAAYYLSHPTWGPSDVTVEYSIIPDGIPSQFLGSGNILNADPLFVDAASDDFHLKSDSASDGTGPNGIDMGMHVPAGASISGPPSLTTAMTDITYTIAGPAITHYKWRLDGGSWSVTEQTVDTAIVLNSLAPGGHTLEVIGKNYAGVWQDQADAAVRTWTVDSSHVALIINEVKAHSHSVSPDLIELYYDGPGTLDMAGMSITDNPGDRRKYVFGAGTTINPGEYMVLIADPTSAVPGHLNFALTSLGDGLYLYDAGESVIDSVEFGMQWNDWSIGRLGDDEWYLTVPTLGLPNVKQPLGDPAALKINEWLANGNVLLEDDFIELYNPSPYPINLSDLYLTDNHVTQPLKSCLGPLSIIEPNGYVVFTADDKDRSAHVDFKLSADHEIIALYDGDGNEIDKVIYYAQKTDVSQGRSPDGSENYAFFSLPTPWLANPVSASDETIENLIDITHEWSFDQSDTDLGIVWRDPDYIDSSWPSGAALLYVEGSSLPAPKSTPLTLGATTYYFRSHFSIPSGINIADIVRLNLATVVDDAAVIYLNGAEVERIGFNDTTVITHNTWADRNAVGNAAYEYFEIPATGLLPNDNVIAVEVHQKNSGSSDVVFGLALDAVVSVSQGDDPLANAKALLDNLRITELMYNPSGGEEYEFIELQNTGAESFDLSGVRFTDGIDFTFPAQTELAAGGFVVLAADRQAFALKYPTVPQGIVFGPYDGKFDNGGENIVLQLPEPFEAAILRFEYDDAWYPATDGDGYSLVIDDPTGAPANWQDQSRWRRSDSGSGSPGEEDVED